MWSYCRLMCCMVLGSKAHTALVSGFYTGNTLHSQM